LVLHPLVVDLDGTLIHTDMLHESALKALRNKPWVIFFIPYWLYKGKAALKNYLARLIHITPNSLPYNIELLSWLKQQKAAGRKLILCTASDWSFAVSIAEYLEIFDEVLASDGSTNLAGKHKAKALEKLFDRGGFDYAGNSNIDLAIWQLARYAVVVGATNDLVKKVSTYCKVERVFPGKTLGMATWSSALRLHQWLKNLLLFIPLFAAHELTSIDTWVSTIFAFFSFSICASSVYIINDLLDMESDRLHLNKRNRPFASGAIPVWMGVILAPLLLLISWGLGSYVGGNFLAWLMFYFTLTCAYSWGLKRLILVDCLTLAMLYTLRIIAGAVAANMGLSFWLLAFSAFLFLSLAFVKRYAELQVQMHSGHQKAHGRGYYTSDSSLIQTMGITSGYASVLVLALYLNSETILKLYKTPQFVWGAVPIMLFWISWMWVQAHRGMMHDDPLVFAVKDKASLLAGFACSTVMVMGTIGWPW